MKRRSPAKSIGDKRLAHHHKPSASALRTLELMEKERSCDAVAKLTGLTVPNVWEVVKRWRPDLLGPRYLRRSAR